MKRKVLLSLVCGLLLTALSLLYKSGPSSSTIEPMPAVDTCGQPGGFCGVVMNINPSGSEANRGFPLPIVSVLSDYDGANSQYHSFNVTGLAADYALYVMIALGGLVLLPKLSRRSKQP